MDTFLSSFDLRFRDVDRRSRELLSNLDDDQLFLKPRAQLNSLLPYTCGEYILRSAGMVERSFGGITTRLWDDPFEWTLPEEFAGKSEIIQYLDEVDATRSNGFSFFTSDADLMLQIPAPEKLRSIHDILLDTIALASHFQGRAFAVFQMLSDANLPRL